MIRATWEQAKGRMIISVEGHEGVPEGEALVCCAVSTIMQTAVCGLIAIANDHADKLMVREIKGEPPALCERCGHRAHPGDYCRESWEHDCRCYMLPNGQRG